MTYLKASGMMLLAFCFYSFTEAQQLKSLSGANSPQDDQNPVWIGDNTLLFSRAFHPMNLGGETDPGDIWMTRKNDAGVWEEAIHRADLSTDGYDFALGLEDVLTLLVYHKGSGRNGLYQYSKFGKDWNFLRQVNFEGLEELQGQLLGRVAKGGKLIFISGKGADTYGNEDIYVSEKIGIIDWSKPVNIGSAINTKGQEMSPYFNPSTQMLYFASNMHQGASGKDIFISKKTGEGWKEWSKPEKWEQISSNGSEVSVTFISDEEVVWSSTMNSDGFADLMTFETPIPLEIPTEFSPAPPAISPPKKAVAPVPAQTPQTEVKITSLYPNTSIGKPEIQLSQLENLANSSESPSKEMPISWLVIDAKNKKQLDFNLSFFTGSDEIKLSNSDSILISTLEEENVDEIKVISEGFFPKKLKLSELNRNDKTVVLLTKLEAGSVVLLENVNFKRGTAELEGGQTEESLSELAAFLLQNPNVKLRINGHTDAVGDPGLNKGLSLERAKSVRDYLVEKGVEFENLRISGWGGTRPLASNATEAGRSKNRRVELEVIQ
ncbi:OmpA family protein [Algoriphagus pacificus]|uniref:OmpA family protein n=1 Tax=Algoriphagus pacificus TaxID=2811234 RepID=A0ABS3CJD1_9BACT|nr:OmpA family protein [Algoriphagus pacificus]MBN7816596.1 OmpA family protein [Algoriphagus pacificus]